MTPLSAVRPVPRLGLSRSELAVSIGVSINSIDKMVDEGALPPPRKWHERQVFLIDEVLTAMQAWPSKDGKAGKSDEADDEWRAAP
jgi:hypothetical protein